MLSVNNFCVDKLQLKYFFIKISKLRSINWYNLAIIEITWQNLARTCPDLANIFIPLPKNFLCKENI